MEQDTDKTKKKRKKRNTIRNLLQATAKRIKITKGQSTPPPLRKREKTRPDIIVESGDLVRLTEEHIHGLPEEDATDYLVVTIAVGATAGANVLGNIPAIGGHLDAIVDPIGMALQASVFSILVSRILNRLKG